MPSDPNVCTVNYASAVALELRQNGNGEPVIRFNFKNGSEGFNSYPMTFPGWDGTSGGDAPLSTFLSAFEPIAINSTLDWCNVCAQTEARGCGQLLAAANSTSSPSGGSQPKISRVGAGFLGAGLAIAVMLMALGALAFLGFLTFGRSRRRLTEKEAKL